MKQNTISLRILALAALLGILAGCGAGGNKKPAYTPGSWSGDVYTSKFLKLQYTLPPDWTASTPEELLQLAETNGQPPTQKQRKGDYSDAAVIYELAVDTPNDTAFFILTINNLDHLEGAAATEEEVFERVLEGVKSLSGEGESGAKPGEVFDQPVGGITFRVLPITYFSGQVTQWYALCIDGSYQYNISLVVVGQEYQPQDLLEPFSAL